MTLFSFNPAEVCEQYREQGWVHIPNGVHATFLDELRTFADSEFGANVVEGRGIGGTKQQAVCPFWDDVEATTHLFDTIAELCNLRRETMTLSERHIKAYDGDTPNEVPPHKDRLSSQVSVGISVDVPAGSSLVLYPDDDRTINPFNVASALRERLAPDQLPEVTLAEAREVVIEDKPGDVMVFPGSTMWHKRRRGAGVVNLYLKFNDFDSDPLGEDPSSLIRRAQSLRALESGRIEELRATLSRRLDTITHQTTRADGVAVITADVWGEQPVALTDAQARLLEEIDGRLSVLELTARFNGSSDDRARSEAQIRHLVASGVIDLC